MGVILEAKFSTTVFCNFYMKLKLLLTVAISKFLWPTDLQVVT